MAEQEVRRRRTRRKLARALAPHLRRHRDVVVQPRLAIDHLAEQPRLDHITRGNVQRRSPVGEVDIELRPRAFDRIIDRLAVLHRRRQRLLRQDVADARLSRGYQPAPDAGGPA